MANPTPRTPQEVQAAQGLAALQEARTLRRARPLLPGEALPPEPPSWAGPAPELPAVTPWHRLTPGEAEAAWHAMLTRAVARQKA
jgi:hypothetical protein